MGERIAAFAIEQLWDEEASAFRAEPAAGHGEVALPPMLPLLGNGEMAVALADLADHTGRAEYARYAERAVAALGARAAMSPAGPALALAALRLADQPPRPISTEILKIRGRGRWRGPRWPRSVRP